VAAQLGPAVVRYPLFSADIEPRIVLRLRSTVTGRMGRSGGRRAGWERWLLAV